MSVHHRNITNANRNAIFNLIYAKRSISKSDIASELEISLPTVTRYVNDLHQAGIVFTDGYFESTGGRKAVTVSFNKLYRIAIGVEIRSEYINLAALNLFGELIAEECCDLHFSNDEYYCALLGNCIMNFFVKLNIPSDTLIGVGVAIQGLVDKRGEHVIFGDIIGSSDFSIQWLRKYIPFQCVLKHDTEVSAAYMLWNNPQFSDVFYLVLNEHLGGALIVNQHLHWGTALPSGLIEHMILVPNGRPCYCGKKGCADAYCSLDAFEASIDMDLDLFFSRLRNKDAYCAAKWKEYLSLLSTAIYNLQIVNNFPVVISGKLSHHIIQSDLDEIQRMVSKDTHISNDFPPVFIFSDPNPVASGAALYFINEFLNSFRI